VEATSTLIELLGAKKSLQQNLASLETKSLLHSNYELIVKMVKFNVVDKRQLVIEGENFFQDVEVESSKVDDAIADARFTIDQLGLAVKAMDVQLQEMNLMGGVSFWPKPIFHLPMSKDYEEHFFSLTPCRYCNRGYHYNDFAMTSCKHAYRPFYLVQVTKSSNKCLVYGSTLHFDWWRSWGF
jgi:hypothetical protein